MLEPLVKGPITQLQLVRYAGASGDFNPLHVVESFGRQTPFGGTIAHGMLVMAFAAEAVTRWIPRPALRRLDARFVGVTRPGDTITVTGRITDQGYDGEHWLTGEVMARDQNGAVKLQGQFRAVGTGEEKVRIT